ncbi:MAG: hypothetical protein Q8Q04_01570 [archaeon]|nr:hypothetical protein [archaeon]
MGTQIDIWTPNVKKEERFCKDSSMETLIQLLPKYNVIGFKSIELDTYMTGTLHTLYLLKIKDFSNKYLEPKKFVKEIDFSEFGEIIRKDSYKIGLIKKFGEKYLVKKVEEQGPIFIDQGKGPTWNESSRIENYFETRIEKPVIEMEENLRDLLNYSNVLMGKFLSLPELEEIILSKN